VSLLKNYYALVNSWSNSVGKLELLVNFQAVQERLEKLLLSSENIVQTMPKAREDKIMTHFDACDLTCFQHLSNLFPNFI